MYTECVCACGEAAIILGTSCSYKTMHKQHPLVTHRHACYSSDPAPRPHVPPLSNFNISFHMNTPVKTPLVLTWEEAAVSIPRCHIHQLSGGQALKSRQQQVRQVLTRRDMGEGGRGCLGVSASGKHNSVLQYWRRGWQRDKQTRWYLSERGGLTH